MNGRLNPFGAAVLFGAPGNYNLSVLSPERDCGTINCVSGGGKEDVCLFSQMTLSSKPLEVKPPIALSRNVFWFSTLIVDVFYYGGGTFPLFCFRMTGFLKIPNRRNDNRWTALPLSG